MSRLLLGLPRPAPLAHVSAMLDEVVKRVYEVINIQVQGTAFPRSPPWGVGWGLQEPSGGGG